MMVRTKIICTIGPSSSTLETMMEMIKAGMNVARLNFSHGTHAEHVQAIDNLKEARRRLNCPLAIMLDTKGPEVRIGMLKGGLAVLKAKQKWNLLKKEVEGDTDQVSLFPHSIFEYLKEGMHVLFDDGYISSHVISTSPEVVTVEIENGGMIRSGKGVNIPEGNLNLPAVTPRDIEDIRFGCKHDVDIIAASFVRCPEHVLDIRRILEEEGKSSISVIAKIENHEGVQNFDSIVQVADGVMIARGDLGVEVPLSQVPKLQKMMIRKSYLAGKPSVTATQMLESMIHNPRPTRAEASDVANAIYDSTSAVMLSGETAIGKYPVETIHVMKSVVKAAEDDFDYRTFFNQHSNLVYHDVPSAVTLASVKTGYTSNAKAIFAFTKGGATARLVSRLRPSMPIIAMTPNEKSYHQMALNWGVIPVLGEDCKNFAEAFAIASKYALDHELVQYGDLVIVTAGTPFGFSGTTNMMLVESIGDVLVRADSGEGTRIHGNVALVLSADSGRSYLVRRHILVLTRCDESYLPLIESASGIILQNHINDNDSEKYLIDIARKLKKPYLVRADAATSVLKEGQLITLDPEKALVYKGIVF